MPQYPRRAAAKRAAAWLFVIAVACAGCSRGPARKSYVARVGQEVLTEKELETARDTLGDVRAMSREYVNAWIVTQLLYQEAARRGLADSDELRRQLDAAKKRMAIEALLDQVVYAEDTSLVTDDALRTSFNASGRIFALKEDVVHAGYVLMADRDLANAFRSKVLRGTTWSDAVAQIRHDSVQATRLLRAVDDQYFTQAELYPEELWKLARTLGKEEVSFVVGTGAGFYVLKVHGIKYRGEIPDFEFVRNEVRDRLLMEARRQKYEKLIADLRARQTVDIREGDTAGTATE